VAAAHSLSIGEELIEKWECLAMFGSGCPRIKSSYRRFIATTFLQPPHPMLMRGVVVDGTRVVYPAAKIAIVTIKHP